MKLAIVSNINLDPLKSHLRKQGAPDPYFCAYGQHLIELLDETSALYTRDLDTVLIHLDGEELLKEECFRLPQPEPTAAGVADLLRALKVFCSARPAVSVILSSLALPPISFVSYLDLNSDFSPSAVEERMNGALRAFAGRQRNVFMLDFTRLVRLHGYYTLYDAKYWYLGRVKYAQAGFQALAEELGGLVCAIRGGAKKVLVLDLDNTLWGGVLGEDGPDGVRLSEDGIGKAYRDFQKCIKALKSLGVILAINSKNNESDVQEFFENSPMMVLKYDDFIARRINWNNKVDNLREIAAELNLGTDSLVFIDDNPAERELVKQHLGEVAVPDVPSDAALLKTWFLGQVIYRYFPRVSLTDEDLRKTEQYERNLQRREQGNRLDVREFIQSLEIRLKLRTNEPSTVKRIAQLTQKTNQFNMTTRRCTEADIEQYLKNDGAKVYGLEYEDKFGAEGVIGACLVEREGDCARIVNFLLSCRVLGRGVEFRFLRAVLQDLKAAGITQIDARFTQSPKNAVARDFYSNAGMLPMDDGCYHQRVDQLMERLHSTYPA